MRHGWLILTVVLGCGDSSVDDHVGGSGGTGSGSTTTSSTGAGPQGGGSEGGGSAGGGGAGPIDCCELRDPACPGPAPSSAGSGLMPLDRCAFALDRAPSFDSFAPLVDALAGVATPATLADVVADLNRSAVPITAANVPGQPAGVDFAFRWEDEENDKPTWVPQGITGSSDASEDGLVEGRRLAVVSFYWDGDAAAPDAAEKGVRLAFVDITDPGNPTYRFVLLVEPKAGPDWAPVAIHAGGIAWFGRYLYVADTGHGLRVFDTTKLLSAATDQDVIGCAGGVCRAGLYKYALPQVGAYDRSTPCDPAPIFSFVALDRSVDPPRLVTGEYCSDTACVAPLAGRIFRYPLDPETELLAAPKTFAADAFYMAERQVQGGASIGDTFLLSSSEPAGSGGALYTVTTSGRTSHGWVDSPEDLVVDNANDRIFGLSEGLGNRTVFAADRALYAP